MNERPWLDTAPPVQSGFSTIENELIKSMFHDPPQVLHVIVQVCMIQIDFLKFDITGA